MENNDVLGEVNMNIKISFLAILFLFIISAEVSAAGPWKGKIIDVETKEPLEGAVVVAVWLKAWRTPAGDNTYVYEVKEALTDKEGRFEIPSYTPINLLPILTYMRTPYFIIFKPGYLSIEWHHEKYFLEGSIEKPTGEFEWLYNKDIKYRLAPGLIELPKLKTREERLRAITYPSGDVRSKDIPLLYKAINDERRRYGLEEVGNDD